MVIYAVSSKINNTRNINYVNYIYFLISPLNMLLTYIDCRKY